jgi:hypothetical protein
VDGSVCTASSFRKIDMQHAAIILYACAIFLVTACGKSDAPATRTAAAQTEPLNSEQIINTPPPASPEVDQNSGDPRASVTNTALDSVKRSVPAEHVDLVAASSSDSQALQKSTPELPNESSATNISAVAAPLVSISDTRSAVSDSSNTRGPAGAPPQSANDSPPSSTDAPTSDPGATPSVHRYPFTPEEELYRVWYGWNSIDAFRAAKEKEAGD